MSRMTVTSARMRKQSAGIPEGMPERRGRKDRRGHGDELAALLTEAFREERRAGERRR